MIEDELSSFFDTEKNIEDYFGKFRNYIKKK